MKINYRVPFIYMGVSKNRDTPKWSGLQWETLLKWRSWGKPSKLRLFLTSTLRLLVVKNQRIWKICASRQIGKIIFPQFFGVKVVKNVCPVCPLRLNRKYSLQGHVGANHLRGSIRCWPKTGKANVAAGRTLRIGGWTHNPQKNCIRHGTEGCPTQRR